MRNPASQVAMIPATRQSGKRQRAHRWTRVVSVLDLLSLVLSRQMILGFVASYLLLLREVSMQAKGILAVALGVTLSLFSIACGGGGTASLPPAPSPIGVALSSAMLEVYQGARPPRWMSR
jgi:hypothetical protein